MKQTFIIELIFYRKKLHLSIVGMFFLQNNLGKDNETIFFTLQGDDAVSSFPSENNWIAGEKMTYVSTIKNGLLVLATSKWQFQLTDKRHAV